MVYGHAPKFITMFVAINPAIRLPGETEYKPFVLVYDKAEVPNVHVLHAKVIPASQMFPIRIKLVSHRFKQGMYLELPDERSCIWTNIVIDFLRKEGHNVLGSGEGLNGFYFFTDTFKPIK